MNPDFIELKPLTKESFAAFGEVIETTGAQVLDINLGNTQRFHALAQVQLGTVDDCAIINLFRTRRWQHPIQIKMLEQHPLGSQAFIPVDEQPFLMVVADQDKYGQPNQVHAFVSNGEQGINFFQGVWHHPQLILGQIQDFIVVDRQGVGNNLIEQDLPEHLQTHIDLQGAITKYLEK